ncbi:MAG: aminoglycoside phosphotransferase family protein [Oscillospiraceae bacterium]|jgi:serine/threonine-protein kinase|nr:aminoglycoside phosphotransferase family protein [Oscillospiraceae bacterium]
MTLAIDADGCPAIAGAALTPIAKGWSGDKKYFVETAEGQRLLLRIADMVEYDRKKSEYAALSKAAALGLYTPQPIDFGYDDAKVYYLATWLEGEDAASLLPSLTEVERYALGARAGELLRKLHTLPAPTDAEPWAVRFQRKIDERLAQYDQGARQGANGETAIDYLRQGSALLQSRPQTFIHGDFNTTNLIVAPTGKVGVIDFNCYNGDFGDPLWDFISNTYMEAPDPHFFTGLWNGYCGGRPDDTFFAVTAYYFAYDILAQLCGDSDYENCRADGSAMLRYEGFTRIVPNWYLEDWGGAQHQAHRHRPRPHAAAHRQKHL